MVKKGKKKELTKAEIRELFDRIFDPEILERGEKLHRELSRMSAEDWLRPFDI